MGRSRQARQTRRRRQQGRAVDSDEPVRFVSFARFLEPQPERRRAQGSLDRAGQVTRDGVQVDLVAKAFSEGRSGALAVVARPVEAHVYGALDALTDRLEQ